MDKGFDFSVLTSPFKILKNSNPTLSITEPLRKIPCTSMIDDFYSNLIDWADEKIFYTIDDSIYLYNFHTEATTKIFFSDMNPVCSIKCIKQLDLLAVGSSSGIVTFIDLNTQKNSKYLYHRGRISCFTDFDNKIITGSRDRKSKLIDIRTKLPASTFNFHNQEVCGVSVNLENKYLCSGGNDNKVFVADLRRETEPLFKIEDHKAAVKALSWSPLYSSKFVSGGGTADKTIKVWDINGSNKVRDTHMVCVNDRPSGMISDRPSSMISDRPSSMISDRPSSSDNEYSFHSPSISVPGIIPVPGRNNGILLKSINYESQICNLKWLKNNKILSTFGYSNDDIKLLNDFNVEKKFTGHKNRVIHFAVSNNERYFVSGSGDSSIQIWEIEGRGGEEVQIR